MTPGEQYAELQAYADRMDIYLVIVGCLFVLAVGMTAYLLFFLGGDEDDD